MSPKSRHLESAQDLALLLGPREADIMRLIWAYGSATVREIHSHLIRSGSISYNTVRTICERLRGKGLLERQPRAV